MHGAGGGMTIIIMMKADTITFPQRF